MNFYYDASGKIIEETAVAYYGEEANRRYSIFYATQKIADFTDENI